MGNVAIVGSRTTGHSGFGPAVAVEGDPLVTVNGQPVVCVGDAFSTHSNGDSAHAGVSAQGSTMWSVNGQPVSFVGCKLSCGDTIATGDALINIEQ